jgi:hypothetical protein
MLDDYIVSHLWRCSGIITHFLSPKTIATPEPAASHEMFTPSGEAGFSWALALACWRDQYNEMYRNDD